MPKITEAQYRRALARIEELLPLVNSETAVDDPNGVELDIMSAVVEEYEQEHFPVGKPTVAELLAYEMEERRMTLET